MSMWTDATEYPNSEVLFHFSILGGAAVELETIPVDPVRPPVYRVTVGNLFSSMSWMFTNDKFLDAMRFLGKVAQGSHRLPDIVALEARYGALRERRT